MITPDRDLQTNRRLFNLAEILLILALIEYGLWILGPQISRRDSIAINIWWSIVLLGGVYIAWLSPLVINRDPPSLRGWAWPHEPREGSGQWRVAWPAYAGTTAALATGTVFAGFWRDPLIFHHINQQTFSIRLVVYLLSGPIQALIFFGFIQTRLRTLIPVPGNGNAQRMHMTMVSFSIAVLFAILHTPNWPIIVPAFAVGLIWSWLFYQKPNVLLLGLSHATLGTVFHQFIGISFRIGPFYHDPDGHIIATVIPGFATLVGNRF